MTRRHGIDVALLGAATVAVQRFLDREFKQRREGEPRTQRHYNPEQLACVLADAVAIGVGLGQAAARGEDPEKTLPRLFELAEVARAKAVAK